MWDLSPLERFSQRVNSLAQQDIKKTSEEALSKEFEYQIHGYYNCTVSRMGTVLTVLSPNLWYKEFGTGFTGQGTYPDSSLLPTQTLTFYSRGVMPNPQQQTMWSTAGWEYAYHPDTKKLGYWFTPTGGKTQGMTAIAGMWKSTRYIKDYHAEIIRKMLRSVGQ